MERYPFVSSLDPKNKFDPDETWTKLVNLFKESIQNKDIMKIKSCLSNFEHYSNIMTNYFDVSTNLLTENVLHRKKLNEMILGTLYDFSITFPILDINIQVRSAILFICMSKLEIYRSDISLSLAKALTFYEELFKQSDYLLRKITSSQVETYLEFFSNASYYFDDTDSDILIERHLDKIGLNSVNSIKNVNTLLRFYPSTISSFDKIINHLIPFIENPKSSNITSAIMRYLIKCYKYFRHNKFFDWKPYIRPIFNSISSDFISSENILGKNFNINKMKFNINAASGYGYDRGSIFANSSIFLTYLLIEYDEEKDEKTTVSSTVLTSLKDFVNTFIPMMNPKSEKAKEAVKFVTKMISYFHHMSKTLKKLKTEKVDFVKNQRIDDNTVEQFVSIVLPFVECSLFNAPHSLRDQSLKIVSKLADLSYEKTVGELLPFCMKNMVDSELTSMAKICFRVVKVLIPHLLNEFHIEDNLTKIPSIIDASLEFCKNALLTNYYSGMSTLSEIAQFVSVPDEKTLTSQFSMKKRMVANAMINSLQVVINCHFEHNKPLTADYADNPYNNMLTGSSPDSVDTPVNTKNSDKGPLEKRFICYFTAFDDSYIESIVIPNVLKNLKNSSDATHLNSFTYKFTKYLTKAKPDLISRLLSPKLEEMFLKSNLKRKFFWAHLLSSSFVSCPTFSEKIPHYVELIQNLLNIKDIDKKKEDGNDINEVQCYLKCAHVLCCELLGKIPGQNIIEWSNAEGSDDKLNWGKLYYKYEIKPKWYEIDQNIINSAADSIFKSIQPLLENFEKVEFKIQKKITKIIFSFFSLLSMRGKPGLIEFYDFEDNPILSNIEKSLFEFINKMLSNLQSYQSQRLILSLIDRSFYDQNRFYEKMSQTCMTLSSSSYHFISSENSHRNKTSRFYALFSYFYEISASLYKYTYEIRPVVEVINDNLFNLIGSEYKQVSSFSANLLETIIYQKNEFYDDYFQKKISILQDPNKTKEQFSSAITFIVKMYPPLLLKNHKYLTKFIRTIISTKFEKDWNIDFFLKTIFMYIQILSTFGDVDDSEEFQQLNKEIISIPRTIDDSYFMIILSFIVHQKNFLPSTEIVQFMVNSLTNETDKLHFDSAHCLTILFNKLKPKPVKTEFKTIDEFKQKFPSVFPYVDKIVTGFYCEPHHYELYTGELVYDTKNDEMRNFLINKVFNNEKIFVDLFNTFILMHPKEAKPNFNNVVFKFWKRIGQILRGSFAKFTKNLIFEVVDLLNNNKSDEVQPVKLTCVVELIAAISRASKHWPQEERKFVIDEILVPSCTSIISNKGSNNVVTDMGLSIILNWDYRRNLWLYEIIEEQFKKLNENMNENVLKNTLNFALVIYRSTGFRFINEYIRIMKEKVIPIFDDLKKFKIEHITLFAKLLSCQISFTKVYRQGEIIDENEISYQIASLPFVYVFDKQKVESPEKSALVLFHLFSPNFTYFSFYIPFLVDRFTDICLIDSKLADINGGKFMQTGRDIIMNAGLLHYQNLGGKIKEILFEGVIKGQIMTVANSLPWTSKLNLVGFLHALTLSHLFSFTRDELLIIFDDVLPFFLQDNNQEVRKAARSLVKVFICVVFSDSRELCIEKVNNFLQLAFKEKGKSKKNLFTAVEFASALIANVSIWFSGCPDWLPNIFYSLERIYKRGDCKEEIKEALNDFFTRHEGREIDEIEEYKYVLTGGYLA